MKSDLAKHSPDKPAAQFAGAETSALPGARIRVRGLVQGVGFRPTVWRLARSIGLYGQVRNDAEGVVIEAWGQAAALDLLVSELSAQIPPLARIDSIECEPLSYACENRNFTIAASQAAAPQTAIVPDAAVCSACLSDTLDPFSPRYRYPFTNCTHCGPRFSIVKAIPYDRRTTSMAAFTLCSECQREYDDAEDRRFHAQPNACHACGPAVRLRRSDGRAFARDALTQLDDADAVSTLLKQGHIVAIKGLGGFHLACDAGNETAVEKLRRRKQRDNKPFALMARDLAVIREYCTPDTLEQKLLQSPEAPIVLLAANGAKKLAPAVAPGQRTLGFMLPYTPLHSLILRRMARPIVLTSGNLSDEPQCIDNEQAQTKLAEIADYLLLHDREIVNRVDDSVVRVMAGEARLLRRARGYAPAPLPLPPGFAHAPPILALGSELKNTFCLITGAQAVLSQHIGDLEHASAYADYQKNLDLYQNLFQHRPQRLAIDAHPDYLSGKFGRARAGRENLKLETVQHHHAHIAACLADNGVALTASPVLGIALDGLGYGPQGELWGGEFLLCDYLGFERLGTLKPVALPGGAQAMREPWRNTYAHIMAAMGWPRYRMNFAGLELTKYLENKPLAAFAAMLKNGVNSPPASSCGRLFDAVAAAVGICRDRAGYEGQAAMELESAVDETTLYREDESRAYPFSIPILEKSGLPYIEPLAMWQAVFGDLTLSTPTAVMAARFHKGLARAIAAMAARLLRRNGQVLFDTVALSGGVFQNKILLEQTVQRLQRQGFTVLCQRRVPANDGGLALGQALVAAARVLDEKNSVGEKD